MGDNIFYSLAKTAIAASSILLAARLYSSAPLERNSGLDEPEWKPIRIYSAKEQDARLEVNPFLRDDSVFNDAVSNNLFLVGKPESGAAETTALVPSVDYKTNDFRKDSPEVLLARLVFGEARGCSRIEKLAVACSVINRRDLGYWGRTIHSVSLSPGQYDCFKPNDPNYEKIKDPLHYGASDWMDCLDISKGVIEGKYKDPTEIMVRIKRKGTIEELIDGATHYLNLKTVKRIPSWVSKLPRHPPYDGKHTYFREQR